MPAVLLLNEPSARLRNQEGAEKSCWKALMPCKQDDVGPAAEGESTRSVEHTPGAHCGEGRCSCDQWQQVQTRWYASKWTYHQARW